MSEEHSRQQSSQNDNLVSRLQHKLYRGKATLVALGLFIGGLIFIILGSMVHGEGLTAELGHHLLRDVGIAALISALLGSAYEYLLRDEFIDDAQTGLERVLVEDRKKLDRFHAMGLEKVHASLTWELLERNFARVIAEAQKMPAMHPHPQIRIVDTWTGFIDAGIMKLIEEAALAGCKVSVLLLDPCSPQVAYRAKAMRQDTSYVKGKIKGELQELCRISTELRQQDNDNFTVKVYDSIVPNHMYDFDGTIVIGMYWRKHASFMGPQLELAARKEHTAAPRLDQLISDQFDDLWNLSEPDVVNRLKRLDEEENQLAQAHVFTIQLKPGNIGQRIKVWRESLLPILDEQKGFQEALILGDYNTNHGMSITLWESEHDLQDAMSDPETNQKFAEAGDLLATDIKDDIYDVLLRERARSPGPM